MPSTLVVGLDLSIAERRWRNKPSRVWRLYGALCALRQAGRCDGEVLRVVNGHVVHASGIRPCLLSILQAAFKELQNTTKTDDRNMRAFEMLVFNQIPVTTVCDELEMTAQQAYMAKSRTAKRLKDIIDRIEVLYDEDAT